MTLKLYQRVLLLLSLPLCMQLLTACCECSGEQDIFTYFQCEVKATNLDNKGLEPIETSADSMLAEAYGIRMQLSHKDAICQREKGFSFMNGAYAFSCDCPPEILYTVATEVTTIRIISLTDFNQDRPAGSVVTDYFRWFKWGVYHKVTAGSLRLNEDMPYALDSTSTYDLLLLEEPEEKDKTFQFRIEIELLDGTLFFANTSEIVLI
ncbi:MAG: DUF5034 domain-containing protein [Bacteroidia bacterium]